MCALLALLLAYAGAVIGLPFLPTTRLPHGLDAFTLGALLHAVLFVPVALTNRYLAFHHQRARLHGYLSLFLRTRYLESGPIVVWTLGIVSLLLTSCIWPRDHATGREFRVIDGVPAIVALYVAVALEIAAIAVLSALYFVVVHRHNTHRDIPDAHVELSGAFGALGMLAAGGGGGGGNYGTDDFAAELIEKQAEMIRYLQEQKRSLSRQILDLRAQLDLQQPDYGRLQETLLSREQEIRSLKMDRHTLESKFAEEEQLARREIVRLTAALEVERAANREAHGLLQKVRGELDETRARYSAGTA